MKILALFLLVSACSMEPLTEDQIYEREVAKIEATDEYIQEEIDCRRRGGVMIYDYYTASKKNRALDPDEIKDAHCETSVNHINGSIF